MSAWVTRWVMRWIRKTDVSGGVRVARVCVFVERDF